MNHIALPADYCLTPQAITIALNALGEANRTQCSAVGGASVKCYINGVTGLEYDVNHQYREWPIVIYPTYFNTDTVKYVYLAIPKTQATGTVAMVVFPSEQLDIYGVNASDEQVGSTDFFYIWLQGIISAATTVNSVTTRSWTQTINEGLLGTEQERAARIPVNVSELNNDIGLIDVSEVTADSTNKINVANKALDLAHKHDWGSIVNKPNLVEGITAGNGKLSFLFSNGDVAQLDFQSVIDALNASILKKRGTVIDPYVWATSYDPNSESWTDHEGDYWFDTTDDTLKMCTAVNSGTPTFVGISGKYLLWNERTGELVLYTNYGTPSSIIIFTAI